MAVKVKAGGNVDLGVVDADLVAIADWQHDYASEWADGYDGYGVDGLSKDAIEKLDELVMTAQSHITEVAKHATVGAGTCVDEDSDPNDFRCSACGARSYIQANDTYTTVLDDHVTILKKFNYCPNCGARVVSE